MFFNDIFDCDSNEINDGRIHVYYRYHFEHDQSKFLPTITLENRPIDLGIMWPQAVFGSPQFDEVSEQ